MNVIRKFLIPGAAALMLYAGFGPPDAHASADRPTRELFAYGTIDGLLAGAYDGELSIAELSRKGDFGLGTFDHLDGELIMLDGKTFQAKADGGITLAQPSQRTPLAYVLTFQAGDIFRLGDTASIADIERLVDARLTNKNRFYGVRVSGMFAKVRTRAIAAQSKPYRPLALVAKEQKTFARDAIAGTLVGIRSPSFSKGISVPGWHWHFIDDAHAFGGHVLSTSLIKGKVEVSPVDEFHVRLPTTDGFAASDQSQDRSQELQQVEKGGR